MPDPSPKRLRLDRTRLESLARKHLAEGNQDLTEPTLAQIVREVVGRSGLMRSGTFAEASRESWLQQVDEIRLAEETYLATIAEQAGVGSVRGLGSFLGADADLTEAQLDEGLARLSGRNGTRPVTEADVDRAVARALAGGGDLTDEELDEALAKISGRSTSKGR